MTAAPFVSAQACRADKYLLMHMPISYSSVQFTQSTHASVDAWMDLVRGLPEDPPLETLMSHSALKATIVRIYDLRMSDIMKSPNPQELVSRDSVFDSIANYFNQQFAGDGEEVYMPELMEIDGPVARLLMSCRFGIFEAFLSPHSFQRLVQVPCMTHRLCVFRFSSVELGTPSCCFNDICRPQVMHVQIVSGISCYLMHGNCCVRCAGSI